jgi:sialate O-acetylesterase
MLSDSLGVPVGIIHNALGGSPAEAWIDRKTLEFEMPRILTDWRKNDHIQQWVRERASQNIAKATNPYQRHPYEPAYLFETGIEPLAKYPVRGAIWYQGESNAHNIECHEELFPLLVDSWRNNWGDAAMPFYYVQLSSLNRPSWPLFRDSQRRLMSSRPALGMAVSSDRGDSLDVHPRLKGDIGRRLASWALHDTYGHKGCVPSGPLYRSVDFKGNTAVVSFDYAEGLAPSSGSEIIGFEIADETGVYHPAKAVVKGNTVSLTAKEVKKPMYVRYGWQPFTRANLVNGVGYPASTFRNAVVK